MPTFTLYLNEEQLNKVLENQKEEDESIGNTVRRLAMERIKELEKRD